MSKPTTDTPSLPDATRAVYATLDGLSVEQAIKVIRATMILLGHDVTIEQE